MGRNDTLNELEFKFVPLPRPNPIPLPPIPEHGLSLYPDPEYNSAMKEFNFDGIVGPTHNYAGLSFGNVASTANRQSAANPKQAALQGLRKMKFLHDLGIPQAVLPPQERPSVETLRNLGFTGTDEKVLARVGKDHPGLLAACSSASSMWTANAATVSPSADSADHKVHFTPANLSNKFHRSLEAETTSRVLKSIFADEKLFAHHDPLPAGNFFSDEGAANHTRFYGTPQSSGVQLFVHGRSAFQAGPEPKRFPARQTAESCAALIRLHRLNPDAVVVAQQNPEVIDSGVFHNDVIAVGNANFFFFHEKAFLDSPAVVAELSAKFKKTCGTPLKVCAVKSSELTLDEVIQSYLFNTQLVSQGGKTHLFAPEECRKVAAAGKVLDRLVADGFIQQVHYLDLRQSMQNGGGPACLRLRVGLTAEQEKSISASVRVLFDDKLYSDLVAWVKRHYREELRAEDLADPALLRECRTALQELSQLLKLGNVFPFQRHPK